MSKRPPEEVIRGRPEEAIHGRLERPSVDDRKRPSVDDQKRPSMDDRKRPSMDDWTRPSMDDRKRPSVDDRKRPSVDGPEEAIRGRSEEAIRGRPEEASVDDQKKSSVDDRLPLVTTGHPQTTNGRQTHMRECTRNSLSTFLSHTSIFNGRPRKRMANQVRLSFPREPGPLPLTIQPSSSLQTWSSTQIRTDASDLGMRECRDLVVSSIRADATGTRMLEYTRKSTEHTPFAHLDIQWMSARRNCAFSLALFPRGPSPLR